MKQKELTISNIWGQIPIGNIVQENCDKCIFAQIAILGGKDYGGEKPCYKRGVDFCLKLLQDRHPKANLAHLMLISRNCGSPNDPAGGAEWKDYAGSIKKLEKAFESELPSLEGAGLEKASFRGADLRGAILKGAYLEGANLEGVDLKGAGLEGACLRDANLIGAYLEGADLEYANLEYADLRGAILKGAYLEGANLEGADLEGACLEGACLRRANLDGARYNSETKFPAGFDTEDKGMIKV